jgi:hypothetical protein
LVIIKLSKKIDEFKIWFRGGSNGSYVFRPNQSIEAMDQNVSIILHLLKADQKKNVSQLITFEVKHLCANIFTGQERGGGLIVVMA